MHSASMIMYAAFTRMIKLSDKVIKINTDPSMSHHDSISHISRIHLSSVLCTKI